MGNTRCEIITLQYSTEVEFKIDNFVHIRVLITFVSLSSIFIICLFVYYNITICPVEIREILMRQVHLRNSAGCRL